MSFGLPVVASRVGGIPEVVEDGATGCLVPAGDAASLAAAMADLLSRPEFALALGREGLARVHDEFSLESMTRAYLDLYDLD